MILIHIDLLINSAFSGKGPVHEHLSWSNVFLRMTPAHRFSNRNRCWSNWIQCDGSCLLLHRLELLLVTWTVVGLILSMQIFLTITKLDNDLLVWSPRSFLIKNTLHTMHTHVRCAFRFANVLAWGVNFFRFHSIFLRLFFNMASTSIFTLVL